MKPFFVTLVIVVALGVGFGCSSDENSPLGTEFVIDSLILSGPGEVFIDFLFIGGDDTTFVTNSHIPDLTILSQGRDPFFESSMIVRVDFTPQGIDPQKTVNRAELRLVMSSPVADTIRVIFFDMTRPYVEGDTMTVLSLGAVIPDDGGVTDRVLALATTRYELPDQLVQDWIRGDQTHNGIAVVMNQSGSKTVLFGAREGADAPNLLVVFTNGDQTTYPVSDDGTFVAALNPPSDLGIGDGRIRRVLLPFNIGGVDSTILIHNALLEIHTVPSSSSGGDVTATLYAPESLDISDPGIVQGALISTQTIDLDDNRLRFPVSNILADFIASGQDKQGFVLQYALEKTSNRQIEFYGSSAADSLKPVIILTISNAPTFPRP